MRPIRLAWLVVTGTAASGVFFLSQPVNTASGATAELYVRWLGLALSLLSLIGFFALVRRRVVKQESETVGQELKRLRDRFGIAIEDFESSTGLTFATLLEIENDQLLPAPAVLSSIVQALYRAGATTEDLEHLRTSVDRRQHNSRPVTRTDPQRQPIWFHIKIGAKIGTLAGVILWLASGVGVGLIAGNVPMLAYCLGCAIWWTTALISRQVRVRFTPAGRALVLALIAFGFSEGGFLFGLLLGSVTGGGIVGFLAGSFVGTAIGLFRAGRLPRAPDRESERVTAFVGLVVPVGIVVAVFIVYRTLPIEVLNTPGVGVDDWFEGLPSWAVGGIIGMLWPSLILLRNVLAR